MQPVMRIEKGQKNPKKTTINLTQSNSIHLMEPFSVSVNGLEFDVEIAGHLGSDDR